MTALALFTLWIAWAKKIRTVPLGIAIDRVELERWLYHRDDR